MGRLQFFATAVALSWASASVAAEPVVGLWTSPPDGKGQTGIVKVSQCGTGYCGTLIKAFDPNGKEIVTKNVGKRLIWDMKPAGGGSYTNGRAFVPIFGKDFPATMQLQGNVLKVKGCAVGVCKSQVWKRAR